MPDRRLLLTGATGIVGCELVRELLRSADPPQILAVLRGTEAQVEAKRRWLCAWADVPAERAGRLAVLRGDFTEAGLGLAARDQGRAEDVTGIIHAGAATRFDQAAEDAQLSNVAGTGHVLAFARRLRRLDRIGIISTVFVAGRRGGTIGEDELELGAEFNNEYEHSKALAEAEVRIAMAQLPIAVYRLSIVVGRRTDGHVSRLTGLYPILRLFHEGLMAMYPGSDGQTVDVIPSDFAAAAVLELFAHGFVPGATYHVCAGADRSFALEAVFPAVSDWLAVADPDWSARGQPLPLPVSVALFDRFVKVVELTGNRRLRQIIRQTRMITRQFEIPQAFDRRRFEAAIGATPALQLPHARAWLRPVIEHAVKLAWRQPAPPGAA